MRAAPDANILAFVEGIEDADPYKQAAELVDSLTMKAIGFPTQIPGELAHVLAAEGCVAAHRHAL